MLPGVGVLSLVLVLGISCQAVENRTLAIFRAFAPPIAVTRLQT